jgi:dihydrofolate reductase
VARAIDQAREIAGDRNIGVNAGKIASQCLELGLLDEVWLDLVPLILGSGTRYFDELGIDPVLLDGPETIQGNRVTHLGYTVRKETKKARRGGLP